MAYSLVLSFFVELWRIREGIIVYLGSTNTCLRFDGDRFRCWPRPMRGTFLWAAKLLLNTLIDFLINFFKYIL